MTDTVANITVTTSARPINSTNLSNHENLVAHAANLLKTLDTDNIFHTDINEIMYSNFMFVTNIDLNPNNDDS